MKKMIFKLNFIFTAVIILVLILSVRCTLIFTRTVDIINGDASASVRKIEEEEPAIAKEEVEKIIEKEKIDKSKYIMDMPQE